MAKNNDFNMLPERANKAGRAIGNLTQAFQELSEAGTISHRSLTGVATALGAVPGPLGAVSALVGPLALQFLKAKDASDNFRSGQASLAAASNATRDALDTYYQALVNGSSEAEAQLLREKDAYRSLFDEQRRVIEAEITKMEADNAKNLQMINKLLAQSRREEGAIRDDSIEGAKLLTDEYVRQQDYIDQLRREVDDLARSIGGEVKQTNESIEAHRRRAAFLERNRNQTKAYTMMIGELADVLGEEGDEIIRINRDLRQGPSTTGYVDFIGGLTEELHKGLVGANSLQEGLHGVGMVAAHAVGEVAVAAFDQYADAWDRVIDGQNAFNKNSGRQFQNSMAQILRSFGQQAAMQALMETAYGIAASTPYGAAIYGPPGPHFAAAAMFGSAAALAGVGSAALSVKSPSSGGGSSGTGRAGASGPDGGPSFSITVIGNLDDESAQDLGRRIAKAMSQGDA